ncbi:MAG TPA: DUF411 domain-containing protein [Longimicrobiaceae bacterium]
MLTRRAWLATAAGAAAALLSGRPAYALASRQEILVYKSPTCGCCSNWVDHMAEAGFQPTVRDVADVSPLKRDVGVPAGLDSCHTALVGGYFVEGHVPADLVQKLLKEKPKAAGLAVPGMPMGSPGMEGPTRQPYDVLLVMRDGTTRVYASR